MSGARMRAAVLLAPRRLELEDVPMPVPGAGQVLVRLEGCGVCGSNLPPWQGRPWFRYPLEPGAPGHEGWGEIAVAGADTGLEPGMRVAMLSSRAFAEYDVADASACVVLPPELDGVDFPGEPFGCATNVVHASRIRPRDTVAVVGSGFFGACIVRLAVLAGARVIALSRRATSLEFATRLGAAEALELEGDDTAAVATVAELTSGRACDVVVEATGTQRGLDLATKLCTTGGRLVIAGFHQDGLRSVDLCTWNWRALDIVNAHERDPARQVAGIQEAVVAARTAAFDPVALITHRIPLERADQAFVALEERPDGFMKAVVLAASR